MTVIFEGLAIYVVLIFGLLLGLNISNVISGGGVLPLQGIALSGDAFRSLLSTYLLALFFILKVSAISHRRSQHNHANMPAVLEDIANWHRS